MLAADCELYDLSSVGAATSRSPASPEPKILGAVQAMPDCKPLMGSAKYSIIVLQGPHGPHLWPFIEVLETRECFLDKCVFHTFFDHKHGWVAGRDGGSNPCIGVGINNAHLTDQPEA